MVDLLTTYKMCCCNSALKLFALQKSSPLPLSIVPAAAERAEAVSVSLAQQGMPMNERECEAAETEAEGACARRDGERERQRRKDLCSGFVGLVDEERSSAHMCNLQKSPQVFLLLYFARYLLYFVQLIESFRMVP